MGLGATAYGLLRRAGVPALRRRFAAAAPVLCFHNVVPDALAASIGDPSLHLGISRFTEMAGWLAQAFRVVPLTELLGRLRQGRSLGGLAAITFDDAYLGVFRHALPVLERLGLPATVFIIAAAPDRPRPFWWDRLAAAGRLDDPTRLRCRDDLAGDAERIVQAEPTPEPAFPPEWLPASWDVLRAAGGAGVSYGSHSMTHRNLARLAPADLADELMRSRRRVADELGSAPGEISYPYGCTSDAVAAAAREAGYAAGIALSYGVVRANADPFRIIRINVPASIPVDILDCWTAGIRWNPPR